MLSHDLAYFIPALHPSKNCCNRRLPRITQREEFTVGFRFAYTRTIELQHAGSFPGAACCRTLRPH